MSTLLVNREAFGQTSGCSHPKTLACTWICRLSNRDQWGSSNISATVTTNSMQTTKRKPIPCSAPAGAHKRRHYEFVPGSFVFKEVILDDEDDKAPTSPKVRGRGTRDKPFSLDLNHTREISKPDSFPPLFTGVGDNRSPDGELPITVSKKGILAEQGGPEIGATCKFASTSRVV
jgi:hypothetical protein